MSEDEINEIPVILVPGKGDATPSGLLEMDMTMLAKQGEYAEVSLTSKSGIVLSLRIPNEVNITELGVVVDGASQLLDSCLHALDEEVQRHERG